MALMITTSPTTPFSDAESSDDDDAELDVLITFPGEGLHCFPPTHRWLPAGEPPLTSFSPSLPSSDVESSDDDDAELDVLITFPGEGINCFPQTHRCLPTGGPPPPPLSPHCPLHHLGLDETSMMMMMWSHHHSTSSFQSVFPPHLLLHHFPRIQSPHQLHSTLTLDSY